MALSKSQISARDKLRQKAGDIKYGLPDNVVNNLNNLVLFGSGWDAEVVYSIFEKVEGFTGDLTKFQLVDRGYSRWLRGHRQWVKPNFELVEQAAAERKALCVNKAGQFALLESGFVALSHVWTEGLYADAGNRGLPLHILDQLFEKLKSVEEAEWVWIDSLAVPGGDRDLSVDEEKVKVDLINNMGMIYKSAHTVVILDALTLRLKSTDPVDIAVCLLCGRWRRRMWTYQEARLATRIKVLTAIEAVNFHELIKGLLILAKEQDLLKKQDFDRKQMEKEQNLENAQGLENEKVLDGALPKVESRSVQGIVMELQAMFGPNTLNLYDIWRTCYVRDAGQDVDYARALFPVVGLTWSEKYDRERGMAAIYNRYISDAMNLSLSFGASRLIEGPGWAPSYLNSLDCETPPPTQWTPKGLWGEWHAYKIRSVLRHKTDPWKLYLEFDQGEPQEVTCWVFTSARENEKARLGFIDAVDAGQGLLLAGTPLSPMKYNITDNKWRIIILAKQSENSTEVQVYMTAKIFWLEKVFDPSKSSYLLSHKSPLNHQTTDEEKNAIKDAFTTTMSDRVDGDNFVSRAHRHVRKSRTKALNHLLRSDPETDLNLSDTAGWTPLHWAVVLQQASEPMTKTLLDHGVKPDCGSDSVKTPLILAVERGRDTVIKMLLEYGASQREVSGVTPLTQALYSHRSPQVIMLLIAHGADVNNMDDFGRTPLFYATNAENLECLLQAGADPSVCLRAGRSALHLAAIEDRPDWIEKLVKFGAAVDILERGSEYTPLYYAVINQNRKGVRALIDLQANTNRRCKDGKTLLMHAIQTGNFGIIEDLLHAGAQVDVASAEEKWTPLHIAIRASDSRILNLLLERSDSEGAVWRKDTKGYNACKLAEERGYKNMETMLKRRMDRSENNDVAGYIFIAVVGAIQLSSNYFFACQGNEDHLVGLESYHSPNTQNPSSLGALPRWLSAGYRTIFSFQYFHWKVLALIGVWLLIERRIKQRRLEKLPPSKRLELSWRNRGDDLDVKIKPFFGVVLIVVVLYYMGSMLNEWYDKTTTTMAVLVFITAFFLWSTMLATGSSKWLGFIVIVTPIWGIAIWYTGWVRWQIICAAIGPIVPAIIGRYMIYGMLEDSNVQKRKRDGEEPGYQLKEFAMDFGLYAFFVSSELCFGVLFLIIMMLNVVIAAFGTDHILPHVRKWKLLKQLESRQGQVVFSLALSCLLGSLGMLSYLVGWIAVVVVVLNILATLALVYTSTKSLIRQGLEGFSFFLLGWTVLTEVEVTFGWLKGGIFSAFWALIVFMLWWLKRK